MNLMKEYNRVVEDELVAFGWVKRKSGRTVLILLPADYVRVSLLRNDNDITG